MINGSREEGGMRGVGMMRNEGMRGGGGGDNDGMNEDTGV